MRFTLPDMSCGHCRGAVEKAVAGVDPDADTTVDLPNRTVDIRSTKPEDDIAGALRAAGYPPAI